MPRSSKTQTPRATEQSAAHEIIPEREARQSRRKRETRGRLLDAAMRLMAERGMEGVAINEITEAADVGFGSFYNHFESKEAIYDTLVNQIFEDFADIQDSLVKDVVDPAEAISYCIRYALLRARRDPVWGKLLLREGYSVRSFTRGLGQRLLRDIKYGVEVGRLQAPDLFMSFVAAGGIVLAAIVAEQQVGSADSPQSVIIQALGMQVGDIAERATMTVLTTLGVSPSEASVIARMPLPETNRLDL